MRTGIIPDRCIGCLLLPFLFTSVVKAQEPDTTRVIELGSITVNASYNQLVNRRSALQLEIADSRFMREHFSGNLMQTLQYIPGVRSMDIGSGFSKPVIRGMGFNRISVLENGIKQEGQQWGADRGLEIDAFNAERVVIRKGPASLLYGSDAMGGTIEILPLPPPVDNQFFGEGVILAKSANASIGGSVMLGIKKENWYTKLRYSEQQYGDYRIPADTVVYLTQKLPIHGKKLKNTAGYERNVSLYSEYNRSRHNLKYAISNAYQKAGFFPGAHGVPDASRLEDDGNSRNIDLLYSTVNHFKATVNQQYRQEYFTLLLDVGYQNNHREELSRFHTHYGNQTPPETDPDKELAFTLNTFSTSAKIRLHNSPGWEHTFGWDTQYQQNRMSGYSFLLPRFNRFTTGMFWFTNWHAGNTVTFSGGIRYDYGKVDISPYKDSYLETYLAEKGYDQEIIRAYEWRSYAVNRNFGDLSASIGIVWKPAYNHLFKANIGRSFRLPGANELASNGVHHSAFRHEQGDPNLSSEKGWQLDVSYTWEQERLSITISPFLSWFENYIYLQPTGTWSILPHAGQIYRYSGAETLFAGTELAVRFAITNRFSYDFTGEYLYTYNHTERIPLAFSSPASMRNTFTWKWKNGQAYTELESIAAQNRIARNELATPGAHVLHAGVSLNIPVTTGPIEVSLSGRK
ncbi:MAG: TonB-dependent receptor, partial [Tannerellaceae bacterium]|nr:TonB-dependent receptor [Tannerellaceae bacterium]